MQIHLVPIKNKMNEIAELSLNSAIIIIKII